MRPIDGEDKSNYTQADEVEMRMTYEELSVFGYRCCLDMLLLNHVCSILRKVHRCGPVSMFQHLIGKWSHLTVDGVADKVRLK